MVRLYLRDAYPFMVLIWLIIRAVADNTSDYIRREDIFVNHGMRNVTAASNLQCCVACMLDDICESVSYNDANKICQVNDKSPNIDQTATTTNYIGWTSFYRKSTCRSGWHFYSGSCYLVVTTKQNWTSSESNCQALGGHLVDIQNADEDQFVQDLASNAGDQYSFYWSGLNDRGEEGTLVWSSSAPNQFQETMPGNDAVFDCASLYTSVHTWFMDTCHFEDNSICKAGK